MGRDECIEASLKVPLPASDKALWPSEAATVIVNYGTILKLRYEMTA
jgi:hypothetical protein